MALAAAYYFDSFATAGHDAASINLQRFFLFPAHQINIELGHSKIA